MKKAAKIALLFFEIYGLAYLNSNYSFFLDLEPAPFRFFFGVACLVAFEAWFLDRMTGRGIRAGLGTLLFSHTPWLLGFFWPLFWKMNLPDPHNIVIRKMQILLGLILVTHFFLLTRALLAGSYKRKGWSNAKVFGLTAVFLFSSVTCWTASVCEPSGDEPHYLLMAYSLIHDRDLDLANNYANANYQDFYGRGALEPQGLEHVIDGKRYSHHPFGPVLLVLPGFAVAGRLGAALTMALLAALALYLSLKVLEESGAKGWPVHATGIVGLVSGPLFLFSGLIFPEVPTACLVALSLLLFLRKRWLGVGLALGAMLWMHNRNVLIVLPILFFALWEIRKAKKGRGTSLRDLALGFGIPLVLLALYFHSIYGVWTPLGAHNEPFTSLFRLSHFWTGFFGLLLDQECGLWFHFPVFAMAATGGALLWGGKSRLGSLVIGTTLFYYISMSFYENLGLTPAARYWVGMTPLLLFLIHPAIEKLKADDTWKKLAWFSVGVGVLVNWILAAVPWLRYNKLAGENWILKIGGSILHLPLTSWEPAFQANPVGFASYGIGAFWVVATVGLTYWFIREKGKERSRSK